MMNWSQRERRIGDKVASVLWLGSAVVLLVLMLWTQKGCL